MRERYWEGWIPECEASCCKEPEPLGTCMIHGDYWTDDCPQCAREGAWADPDAPPRERRDA